MFANFGTKQCQMGTETKKIALNTHVHLRTANSHISRSERHVDDITDMRRCCRLRQKTSGRCMANFPLTDTLMNPLFAEVGSLLLLECIFFDVS